MCVQIPLRHVKWSIFFDCCTVSGGELGGVCVKFCFIWVFFSFKHDDILKRLFCELAVRFTFLEVLRRTRKGRVVIS